MGLLYAATSSAQNAPPAGKNPALDTAIQACAASVAKDEANLTEIQRALDVDPTMINLNKGGCSPAPTQVLDQIIRDIKLSNQLPVDQKWRVQEPPYCPST